MQTVDSAGESWPLARRFEGMGRCPLCEVLVYGVRIPPMNESTKLAATLATEVPARPKKSIYPDVFVARIAGREKRALGDFFGLQNFGVNLTRIAAGSESALRHSHEKQDEFIYILEGTPTLVTNSGEQELKPGMCAGFRAGTGDAHHLVNRSSTDVLYLEVGDRTAGESVAYPDDDLKLVSAEGGWRVSRKDGTLY
jgi:uncharacterized cupin superfamily protein